MTPAVPFLVARAAQYRARTAIVDGTATYTYDDLDRTSEIVAAQLLAIGDRGLDLQEQRVAFLVTPGFVHVAVQWGIWRAGGIAVPLPASHPPAELEFLVRDCAASIVVADAANARTIRSTVEAAGAQFVSSEALISGTGLKPCATDVDMPAATSVDTTGLQPCATAISPARRAMIIFTSGTTNRPKGVVTTHAQLTAQIESLVTAWEWTDADRTLLVLPLHHVHGILNVVCCALWSGAVLEMHPRFDVDATWERLASGELTVFTAVPTIYHRLIQSWDSSPEAVRAARSRGCRSMRVMMCGSAALPRTVLDRWKEMTGHVLLERYGMTEVGMALSNPLRGERRPGFVGQPLPGVSVRLVDGELQLRGPGIFSEYWNQPDLTRDSFDDGWFRTGDVAVLENGAYRLLGRASVDIIKSGGTKISALEIEEVLRTHPSIDECAVIGVEDREWGERVCCVAELRTGGTLDVHELRDWAKTRLAAYKIPKELRCVPRLPRNALGKVVKPQLASFFAPPDRPAPPDS